MTRHLWFTLGPVQGFIATARRTRDLWAGSFLLSYLTGHAIAAVLEHPGQRIVVPDFAYGSEPSDPLLRAIQSVRRDEVPDGAPFVGSLVNNFQAEIVDGFDPNLCIDAVRNAFRRAADAVWDEYLADVAEVGLDVRARWDRQIASFWEASYVAADDEATLKRTYPARKNWRSHHPTDEPGDHCTLMGGMQEISGFVRSVDRDRQERFWTRLRSVVGDLDLRPGERLCAVALVKRLYPLVSERAIGWAFEDHASWPSTSYMAAVDWVIAAAARAPDECRAFADAMPSGWFSSWNAGVPNAPKGRFGRLDGRAYFRDRLAAEDGTSDAVKVLTRLEAVVGTPKPYFALLVMDGDSMGALLDRPGFDRQALARVLSKFAESVPGIVEQAGGVTVYAGGDDVMALLPIGTAHQAASELRRCYQRVFPPGSNATISAGLAYAHDRVPLRQVLEAAHHLLDDVAKDRNGRDSIAVAVLGAGGERLTWVTTYDFAPGEKSTARGPVEAMIDVAQRLRDTDRQLSSKFVYGLRERLAVLADRDGTLGPELRGDVPALVRGELRRSLARRDMSDADAETIAREIALTGRPRRREGHAGGFAPSADDSRLDVTPLLIARFLALNFFDDRPDRKRAVTAGDAA